MNDPCPVALRGIVPSLNTPFAADGALDLAGLRRTVDHIVDSGCAGILALAVAAEIRALSPDEADLAGAAVVERAAGRIPVILGASAEDQAERLRRAARARALGADAVLCQSPPARDAAERADLLAAVADAGPDLFMLQDLDWSGPGLAIAEIVALAEAIPRFRCLKVEVVPAGPKYSAVLAATRGRMHVSGGWAVAHMMDALARGVHAVMTTEMEPIYVAIERRFRQGRVAEATALFERLLPVLVFTHQSLDVSIRFHKTQRRIHGLFATDACRPPTAALDSVQRAEAERYLALAETLAAELRQGGA